MISETVQYLDTGIKLEVEPTIYQSDEVMIKVTLEVSDSQDAGRTNTGTTLVRVKTSNAQTSLRLKNGETQILAGLIRNDRSSNSDQIPGLGEIPVVGRLFGQHDDNWKKRELVLSITPRIVRNTPYLPLHQLEYGSGTEAGLRSRPLTTPGPEGVSGEAVILTAPPGVPGPATRPTPAPPPVSGRGRLPPIQQLAPSAAPAPPVPALPVIAPPTAGPAAGAALVLAFQGPARLKVGEEATVSLVLKADQPLVSAALQIGFDPKTLKILEVLEGSLLRDDGTATSFNARTDESAGRVFIGISRSGDTGASGEGAVVQLRVAGIAAGPAPLKLVVFSGIGLGNTTPSATLPAGLDVVVEP